MADAVKTNELSAHIGRDWKLVHGIWQNVKSILDAKIELKNRVTALTISNDSTEQDIFSYEIPGGVLGTNRAMRLTLFGNYLNQTGSAKTLTIRIKYGAGTFYDDDIASIPSSANRAPFWMQVVLANKTWGSQALGGIIALGEQGGATSGIGDIADSTIISHSAIRGTGSVDSTADKDFKVTIQHSAASASLEFVRDYAFLEFL